MAASRVQRWANTLSAFRYKMVYVKGDDNQADFFSRVPNLKETDEEMCERNYINFIAESGNKIDYDLILKETTSDPILSELRTAILNNNFGDLKNEEFTPYLRRQAELYVESDIIMWGYRVIIPATLRNTMLENLHLTHMGMVKCKAMARSYMWWPGMDMDIQNLINACEACLGLRPSRRKSDLIPWENSKAVWSRIHIDFAGPKDNNYFFIITDAFSKWREVFITKVITTDFTITKLRETFARFGLPETIVSDCGTQFTGKEFQNFVQCNGIRHITTPPGNPSSNGAAENAVKTFKKGLMAINLQSGSRGQNVSVHTAVSRYLFDYRLVPHSSTGVSPFEVMFGRKVRTRFDLIRQDRSICESGSTLITADKNIDKSQENQKKYFSGGRSIEFKQNDSVMIRDYKDNRNTWTAAVIVQVLGQRYYLCKICSTGRTIKRHVDQMIHRRVKLQPEAGTRVNGATHSHNARYEDIKLKYTENVAPSIAVQVNAEAATSVTQRPKRIVKPIQKLDL